MECDHDIAISLPHHGFYSVQDESNRRYSRTGKHRILAQKSDAILMKYRYSDETEKSSPYSRTQSDNESPPPSDSPNSYQGVYSPQLAQSSGNFELRRSLIDDEPASKWTSPGLHPNSSDALGKGQHFDYDNKNISDHRKALDTAHKNKTGNILEAEQLSHQRPNVWQGDDYPNQRGTESMLDSELRRYQHSNRVTADGQPNRKPPPPYTVAVRSSKGHPPKSYLDIAPHLTNDLPRIHDINKLLEDLEGSAQDHQILYQNSELAKSVERGSVDFAQQSTISAWAELVHIDHSSEDEQPSHPNSGIIITENRERSVSSPDRHIRFVLEDVHNRRKSDPEDFTGSSQDNIGKGDDNRRLEKIYRFDGAGETEYQEYKDGTVGLSPLEDEVFRYHITSNNSSPAFQRSQATGYGVDNPGYENIEDYGDTSVDHHTLKPKPVSSDVVRRRAIDWYGKGNVYGSSQSSTLDSVFTERSWSSEVGRPRAFREKRRVYPKPKDPVGDLGDGLQTKTGRRVIGKELDHLHHGSASTSRNPNHSDDRCHNRGHVEASRVGHSKRKAPEKDLRKSIINRELELFMKRKSDKDEYPPNRLPEDSHESRRSTEGHNYNIQGGNKTMTAQQIKVHHPTYRNGKYPPTSFHGNSRPDRTIHKPRAFSTEGIDRTVQLRNQDRGRKTDRPLTYPNDINKPFSRLMSQKENNAYPADINAVASRGNRRSSQQVHDSHLTRHPLPLINPQRPERGTDRRTYDQKYSRSQALGIANDRKEAETRSFHKEPQYYIRSREQPPPSGHVHQSGRLPKEERPRHARNHHIALTERRTRDKDHCSSPTITAVSDVPHNPKSESNEIRSRDTKEWAPLPTIAAVTEQPHRPSNQNTTPGNNQPGQQEERIPTEEHQSDHETFTNWRFFSVMAAIWFCPIGIWALRKSHQVDSRVGAKDIPGARRAARSARNHSIAAFVVLGFIVLILVARLIEITVDPRKTFIQNFKIVPDEVDLI